MAFTRRIEHVIGRESTNAEHACVERLLARMTLSLVYEQGNECKHAG